MNIANLSKDELVKRQNFRCVHGHTGLEHKACYEQERKENYKIGYLDIETSNLNADFGIILSYCIKEDQGKIIKRVIKPEDIRTGQFDRLLLKDFCEDVRKFSRVITYYGAKFDIPYLRTRCLKWNLPFPIFQELHHTDAYMVVKHKLNLHSRRLGVVAPFLDIEAKGHPLNPTVWIKCLGGDKKALAFVLKHNEEDVVSLEKLWHRIKDYGKMNKTSI